MNGIDNTSLARSVLPFLQLSDYYALDYTHQDENLGTALCGVSTRPLGSSHSS
jgi:hypothetical protein